MSMATRHPAIPPHLTLHYQDQVFTLPLGDSASIGRADNCEITVASPLASRVHARIASRSGRFVFIDQSTNGSYVRTGDGSEVYLRGEELPLWGAGQIALGESCNGDTTHLLHFRL